MELCGLYSGMSGSKGMGLASFDFVRGNGWQCHWDIVKVYGRLAVLNSWLSELACNCCLKCTENRTKKW
jgi:hypothetical protein